MALFLYLQAVIGAPNRGKEIIQLQFLLSLVNLHLATTHRQISVLGGCGRFPASRLLLEQLLSVFIVLDRDLCLSLGRLQFL